MLDKRIEGFGELFRVLSFETIGTSSLQSRALAGVANGTVIFVLPGSLDAVETAWDRLIQAQLDASTLQSGAVAGQAAAVSTGQIARRRDQHDARPPAGFSA